MLLMHGENAVCMGKMLIFPWQSLVLLLFYNSVLFIAGVILADPI